MNQIERNVRQKKLACRAGGAKALAFLWRRTGSSGATCTPYLKEYAGYRVKQTKSRLTPIGCLHLFSLGIVTKSQATQGKTVGF